MFLTIVIFTCRFIVTRTLKGSSPLLYDAHRRPILTALAVFQRFGSQLLFQHLHDHVL